MADLKVALDGYLGWEGLTSQTIGAIEIALWDILGKALDAPVHRLLGGSAYPIPLYGTGTTMFEESAQWHAHYFDQCMDLGFAGSRCAWAGPSTVTWQRWRRCATTSAQRS